MKGAEHRPFFFWKTGENMKFLISLLLLAGSASAACVDERVVLGAQIEKLSAQFDVYVETEPAKYEKISAEDAISIKAYRAQLLPKTYQTIAESADPFDRYNKRYIKYYTYPRMVKYLQNVQDDMQSLEYKIEKVGKSLAGRDLFYVGPNQLDPNKKTIVMFGRHHGDEGTANWIIEGFVNRFLEEKSFRDNFQLVLYPMVNPDGAMKQTRYNLNGRDLNRSWSSVSGRDEIVFIHGHLAPILKVLNKVVIALDMHGSFREDFIYRVKRSYKGEEFYNMQQRFIDELGIYDPWQASNFILSNGHPGMARLALINHYKLHALTHETIRDIPLRNSRGRSKQSLLEQGEAVISAIESLY